MGEKEYYPGVPVCWDKQVQFTTEQFVKIWHSASISARGGLGDEGKVCDNNDKLQLLIFG